MNLNAKSGSSPLRLSRSTRSLIIASILAAFVAGAALMAESRGHIERTAYGDGLIYRYVASHLTTPPSQIDPVVSDRGTSLRYGRIGFPFLIWLGAAGHNAWIPYAQVGLIAIAAGFAGAATWTLFSSAGRMSGLFPFLAPGFSLAVVGGYGEVMAAALVLWTTILARRKRYWGAAICLAGALLTRENAVFVLLGLLVWTIWSRERRGCLVLTTSLIPVISWYVIVAHRFGHIPPLDPYLRATTDTVGTPFVALCRSLTTGPAGSIATASVHLAIAVVAISMFHPKSAIRAIACAAALQILGTGPGAWRYIGDGMRTSTFLELFTLMIFLSWRWSPGLISKTSNQDVPANIT